MTGSKTGVPAETLASISTPDEVESRLGTLEFDDGAPTAATAELLYDHLDFVHGVEAFIRAYPGRVGGGHPPAGSSRSASRTTTVLLFSELMDSASLFLTANCDTVYFLGFVDLSDGPMVIDVPPLGPPSGILGTIDDMWFGWVTDFGLPGPDRGAGRSVPDRRARLRRPAARRRLPRLARRDLPRHRAGPGVHGRQRPRVRRSRRSRRGSGSRPYVAGRPRHGGRDLPRRRRRRASRPVGSGAARPASSRGRVCRSTPSRPNDYGYWELVDELIQQEPAGAGEPEMLGLLASVGIVKGKPFAPDDRMRKILEEAVVVGNATARTISFAPRPEEGFAYYPGSAWINMLFVGGYQFLDPPPADHRRRCRPRPERRRPQAQLADRVPLPRHRRHAGDVHAADRHRLAVPDRDARRRRGAPRRRPRLPAHVAARHPREPGSGR